jgi:diguanylate cyclase (GGDEF)-like protein
MYIYSLIPLFATVAYIPLLYICMSMRPWQKQHRLFFYFLLSAIVWSLIDYIGRSSFFENYTVVFFKLVLITFSLMAIQFHRFISSYYPPGKGRWLPFAYGSLVVIVIVTLLGYLPRGIIYEGESFYPDYGFGILLVMVPLLVLAARNLYILIPRLRQKDNPIALNQNYSLFLCLIIMIVFMLPSVFPFGRKFPIGHLGSIINALILSYAVIGQQLLDIRFVLRRGLIWLCIGSIGLASFLAILVGFHALLNIKMTVGDVIASSISGIAAVIIIFELRGIVSRFMGKAFQGDRFRYREKLEEFSARIHNVFSLRDQGAELLSLITHSIDCKKAGLLFLDPNEDFEIQFVEPVEKNNLLTSFKMRNDNPIVKYLSQERRALTRETINISPEFLGLWQQEKDTLAEDELELFMPLISRNRLIGILVLGRKKSGYYTLEDYSLLETVTKRVAVSMEKEYLREQLNARQEELSVINSSSTIITSSLDIQRIYDNFIKELKRVVDVDWAAICVIEETELLFMAISTEIGSPWKVGERIPIKGSATEWVSNHQKPTIDSDLTQEVRFTTGKYHLQHSIRSLVYLPLVISNQVIGTLIVGSRNAYAYNVRHVKLLEQLALQIAMPIENARLYAKTERMARVDGLTGLLNRRSLDEILPSEIGRHSRYGGIFSLIIFDIDTFKSLNDNYGHLAGDELLRQLGIIMKNNIRESDQAFRYGGDEFAVLLPQTTIEAALRVAERIRQQTYAEIEIGSSPISISLGLATWPSDGISPTDIIAAADVALYAAKRNGGNRSVCFTVDLLTTQKAKNIMADTPDSGALSTIFALAATVDARDKFSRNHSKQVHDYAVAIGGALGMGQLELNRLSTCALLHDIGKIGISDEVLNKQGTLTNEEWETIKSHSKLGASIVSHSVQLIPCVQGILHHHEKYNGEGYPEKLQGEAIPLESRILAIADSFSSMTSARVYSLTLTFEAAKNEIIAGAGKQFDPKLVEIFLTVVQSIINPSNQTAVGTENK